MRGMTEALYVSPTQDHAAPRNARQKARGNILSLYTREEGNRAHLVTLALHCPPIGHRQMKLFRFVGFCLCAELINRELASAFSTR